MHSLFEENVLAAFFLRLCVVRDTDAAELKKATVYVLRLKFFPDLRLWKQILYNTKSLVN